MPLFKDSDLLKTFLLLFVDFCCCRVLQLHSAVVASCKLDMVSGINLIHSKGLTGKFQVGRRTTLQPPTAGCMPEILMLQRAQKMQINPVSSHVLAAWPVHYMFTCELLVASFRFVMGMTGAPERMKYLWVADCLHRSCGINSAWVLSIFEDPTVTKSQKLLSC